MDCTHAPARECVYYVTFAREFKHAKDFCVLKVSGWSSRLTTFATLRDGIGAAGEMRWLVLTRNGPRGFVGRLALPRAVEVFLRLASSAWYADRIPVRISAAFVALMKKIIVAVGSTRKPK